MSFLRRPRERGFALVIAIVIAVLYFALIELLLIDAGRELRAARQFRSRIIALTYAENGAEGAALMIVVPEVPLVPFDHEDEQGSATGRATRLGDTFTLVGDGGSLGLEPVSAHVEVQGYVERLPTGPELHLDVSVHTQ
jgi:hypothetical protein